MTFTAVDMTISGLQQQYRAGTLTPAALVAQLQEAYRGSDNPVWIHQLTEAELAPYLARLEGESPDTLPLFGIPFAIKDNIDLAGIPTTAACPEFAYTPDKSAFVVQQLIDAGAIPMGKTNLDQFATGLVGARSPEPWGPCHNVFNADYISGGSSAGSAVTVSMGWVSFSLGTDTAGSGRVPAMFNNIVGLKPSCGLLSTRGVVPACRSLDAVSIFALTCDDANAVFDQAAVFDAEDAYARPNPFGNSTRYFTESGGTFTFGVPRPEQLEFFGDDSAKQAFAASVAQLKAIGGTAVELDFSPLLSAAKLLYEGPWVTERYLATQPLIDEQPDALLPVIHTIISGGAKPAATDAFASQYRLQAYKQQAQSLLAQVDVLVTPTAGTCYPLAEVLADPIRLNSNLGYYTNFMNLLDLSAIAVPSGWLDSGVGFGVTLFQQHFKDKQLLSLAARLHRETGLKLGALAQSLPAASAATRAPYDHIPVVVCGAHLEGLPLHWQLAERGATLIEQTKTAASYRMYALAGGPPFRPGLVRDTDAGAAIEVEVWAVPTAQFGSFVTEIPAPLGIGKVELADGRWESGFICEPYGLAGALEITELGGWKAYMATR